MGCRVSGMPAGFLITIRMEANEHSIKLYYNTESEKLRMPEYGRNVLKMVEQLRLIEDRGKRSEQAAAVVRTMELLNPQVHQQEDWQHKLWDHLYMIAGYDLDIDAPFTPPLQHEIESKPIPIPLKTDRVRYRHYGRNIESIIELIASEPDGEVKTAMIRSLAIYMRQQYLIWNKDSVADATIFQDIEKLSEGRIKVPEGIELTRISEDTNFARPMMNLGFGNKSFGGQRKNFGKKNKRK